ncbi:hypothetical protein [Ideonella sp. YS5]|uniref:hypothetical protein n=1 Tax=Ideonella sp. YS5 TaxID=3453714 RepID=UPI003EECF726
MHRFLRLALGAACCVTAPALWALPTQYHLQDLGASSEAVHINAKGQAAGTDTSTGQRYAAVWTDGEMQRLDNPYTVGDAYGINAAGVVVGSAGYPDAAIWTSSGMFVDLGQGFAGSYVTSINDKGNCVLNGAVDAETLVMYFAPGCDGSKLVQISAYAQGVAINANDQIAFTDISFSHQQRAYLYSAGTFTDLGVLAGYTQSLASDLNGHAHVVGTAADAAYDLREGFFWNGRKIQKVGTLGGARSEATAVNNSDVVVGSAQTRKGQWHPFVRDMRADGSRMQDLSTMLDASGAGWSLDRALSINKSGQILVRGTAPGDSAPHSAILTPLD